MDERVRELLDRARETAITVGEVAGKRAGQMVDVAKLNMKIFDLKAEVNQLLRQVGQLVYDAHRGEDTDTTPIDGLLADIDEKHEAITELKERVAALKNSRECPVCGTLCGREDKFCKSCGAGL